MDKTRDSTNSKIWPDSTCAISVRRKGQILLVVESLVLSTTYDDRWKTTCNKNCNRKHPIFLYYSLFNENDKLVNQVKCIWGKGDIKKGWVKKYISIQSCQTYKWIYLGDILYSIISQRN